MDVFVDVGQPAAQILVRSDAAHSDLIVMGTHGTSGFEHLLLGSVTEKVLRRAVHGDLTYRDGRSSRSDRDRSSRAERGRRVAIRFNDKPDCAACDVPGPNAAQSTD